MKDTYTLISFKEHINNDLFNFFKREVSQELTEQVFLWEYYHEKSILVYFEKNSDQVVGTYGIIPYFVEYYNDIICIAKGETTYIKSSEQGIGLYESMYEKIVSECINNNIVLTWGFSHLNKNLFRKYGSIVDDTCLKESIIIVKPCFNKNILSQKKSFLKYLYHIYRSFISYFKYFVSLKFNKSDKYIISDNLKNNDDIIKLFTKLKTKYPELLNIRMDIEFLNHRVFKNPFNQYLTFFLYSKHNELLGYIFICLNKKKNAAFIADLSAIDEKNKEILLRKAIKEIRKNKDINSINCFGNISNILIKENFKLLKKYGAKKYSINMHISSTIIDKHFKDINSDGYSNWYINGLWTEGLTQ